MTKSKADIANVAEVPRVTVTPAEAAAALGISPTYFDEHIRPDLRTIRPGGRVVLIAVEELQRWARDSGETVLR